jgi:hypothetical protein
MNEEKESFSNKLIMGLFRIVWAAIPALGMLSLMQALKAPLYFGVGISIVIFYLMGIFDFVLEIRNKK